MNISILKKVLAELQKDDFRKDYVIGILETMIETQDVTHSDGHTLFPTMGSIVVPKSMENIAKEIIGQPQDEGSILDAKARAAMAKVKALSNNE